jgi:hypothetical protein
MVGWPQRPWHRIEGARRNPCKRSCQPDAGSATFSYRHLFSRADTFDLKYQSEIDQLINIDALTGHAIRLIKMGRG